MLRKKLKDRKIFQPAKLSDAVKRRTLANILAKKALDNCSTSAVQDEDVLRALRQWGFRRNSGRTNVIPEGKDFVFSDTLGLSCTRDERRAIVSSATRRNPFFTRLLIRWLEDNLPAGVPQDVPLTSISVNSNYAARRHRDRHNAGPSILRAFGEFSGGALRYWPSDTGQGQVEDLDAQDGVSLGVKGEPVVFDGNRAHEVAPFKGERYSIIFFTMGEHCRATPETRRYLEGLGFRFPSDESMKRAIALVPPPGGVTAGMGCTSSGKAG